MSEWIQIQPFGYGNITNPQGGALTKPSISSLPITLSVDYTLWDENEVVITDENGEPISLEGLAYA